MGRRQRLVEISKDSPQALRYRKLEGMEDEDWSTIETVRDLPRLFEMRTTMGDLRLIVNGGDNRKRRLELSRGGRRILCSQGHSAGSGVRPYILPIEPSMMYLIHGVSIPAAKFIAKEGLYKRQRPHMHFYECLAGSCFRRRHCAQRH